MVFVKSENSEKATLLFEPVFRHELTVPVQTSSMRYWITGLSLRHFSQVNWRSFPQIATVPYPRSMKTTELRFFHPAVLLTSLLPHLFFTQNLTFAILHTSSIVQLSYVFRSSLIRYDLIPVFKPATFFNFVGSEINSFTDSHYMLLQFIEDNSHSYTLGSFFKPVLNTSERKMEGKPGYN